MHESTQRLIPNGVSTSLKIALFAVLVLGMMPAFEYHPGSEALRNGGASSLKTQAGTLHFEWTATWQSEDLPDLGRALEWPAGHLPAGLDSDPNDGTIYVIDHSAKNIRRYAPDLTFIAGIELGATLLDPVDVAVLPGKRLAVSDHESGVVHLVSAAGQSITQLRHRFPTGLSYINDIPDTTGLYLLAAPADALDGQTYHLWRYDADGQLLEHWPIEYDELDNTPELLKPAVRDLAYIESLSVNLGGQLRKAARFLVTAPDDDLVLSTIGSESHVVYRAPAPHYVASRAGETQTQDLAYLARLGPSPGVQSFGPASWDQMSSYPADAGGIEVTSSGQVLITDRRLGLRLLGPSKAMRPYLRGLGHLEGPQRLAASDQALVGDRWPRVQTWGLDGKARDMASILIRGSDTAVSPTDLAIFEDKGYVLSADGFLHRVEGRQLSGFWDPIRSSRWMAPRGISANSKGPVVLDLAGQRVLQLDSNLQTVQQISLDDPGASFRDLRDMAAEEDQVLILDSDSQSLDVYDLGGQRLQRIAIPHAPERLAVGPAPERTRFVLGDRSWVFAFSPEGRARGAFSIRNEAGVPSDIAVDDRGRLLSVGPDAAIRVYEQAELPDPAPSIPDARDRCEYRLDKAAQPQEIPLGQSITITLRTEGECLDIDRSSDIILLIDISGSMGDSRKFVAAKNAAIGFVAQLGKAGDSRIGVIGFSSTTRLASSLEATIEQQQRTRSASCRSLVVPISLERWMQPLQSSVGIRRMSRAVPRSVPSSCSQTATHQMWGLTNALRPWIRKASGPLL